MVPTKRLLYQSSSRILRLLKVVRQVGRFRQYTKFLVACCSCSAPCCHDPFIVRSAPILSTVPWFHSVCASVSMLAITDNCLFLFLFQFLSLRRYLKTTRASVQTLRPLSLHQSKPLRVQNKSVYVRIKSAYLLKRGHPGSADFAPDPSSSPSSCSGVWDPWPVEYQSFSLNNFVEKQRLALLQHLRNSSPFSY